MVAYAYATRYHAGPRPETESCNPLRHPDFGGRRYAAVELSEKDHPARHVVKCESQNERLWNSACRDQRARRAGDRSPTRSYFARGYGIPSFKIFMFHGG
jgi:hypothetical protein